MLSSSPDIRIGWQDYLAVTLRRRWFFITPVIASLFVGLWIAIASPRIYEARALIAIQDEALINPLIKGLAMPQEIPEQLKTLREELLSWSSVVGLIEQLGLGRNLPQQEEAHGAALEALVARFRQDIVLNLRGRTLVQVSYQGRDPATVERVVNTLTDVVVARHATIREGETENAVRFIEAELDVYRKKLKGSEQKLREFKELYLTQMPVATALNSQLRSLEIELAQLLIDNTEAHPRVIEVKRKIEGVRRQRDEEIKRLVARGVLGDKDVRAFEQALDSASAAGAATPDEAMQKAEETYAALVNSLEAPEVTQSGPQLAVTSEDGTTIQLGDAAAASLTLAPRQQQQLIELHRDYNVDASIYTSLLQKLERAKITGRLGMDEGRERFAVIERARLPITPVQPKVGQILVLALFFGVGLGVGAVLLAEYLDQSVQTAEEVTGLLEVPVLGSISTIVTEEDVAVRRRRRQQWFSWKSHLRRVKTSVLQPLWARVDRALVSRNL